MMVEFIHWLVYFLMSTTLDEILSWIIKIWMKNHLVSDGNCDIVNLESPNLQGMTNYVEIPCSVGDSILRFTMDIEQDNYN
jgi:hypothetical protein